MHFIARSRITGVFASVLLLALVCMDAAALAVGDTAPPLQIAQWIKGAPVDVQDGENVYVVFFWASWCGPSKSLIPSVTALQHLYGPQGAKVVAISNEDSATVQAFVDGQGDAMDFTVAVDNANQTTAAYGVGAYPTIFVVDTSGKVLARPFHGGYSAVSYYVEVALGIRPPEQEGHIEPLSTLDLGATSGGMIVQDGTAYVTVLNEGIKILDVSNPSAPALLTTFALGTFRNMSVEGHHAIVRAADGLHLLDISDPERPVARGFWPSAAVLGDVVVVDGKVYVMEGKMLKILSIGPDDQFAMLGSCEISTLYSQTASCLTIDGTHAYAADNSALHFVDVANPAAPVYVGNTTEGDRISWMQAASGRLYTSGEGFLIFDGSSSTVPALLGQFSPGLGGAFALTPTKVFLAMAIPFQVGIRVLDVSNPALPQQIGSWFEDSLYDVTAVCSEGNVIYTRGYNGILRAFRYLDASSPEIRFAPSVRYLTAEGGMTRFGVCNIGGGTLEWSGEVLDAPAWCRIESGSTGGDTGTVELTCDANLNVAPRSATVRVVAPGASKAAADVTIQQAAAADNDGDGLSDPAETALGTNSSEADTDHDGVSDYDEVNRDSNPLEHNAAIDTNPLDPDTDNDGWEDGTEITFGYNPLDPEDYPAALPGPAGAALGIIMALMLLIPCASMRNRK